MQTGPTKIPSRKKASLAAGLDCATAFQKVARDCVGGISAHHSSACAGDAEAVHQIRVAITRLRAAVSFFAPITVDAEWLRLKKEIKWLNAALGAARDSDVMTDYACRKSYQAWAQRMSGEHFDQRRIRGHRRLVRCLRSGRFQRLIEAMSGWVKHGQWLARWGRSTRRKPLEAYCGRELNRLRRGLIRKGRHLETLNASQRHRLRIRAKRFRYILEALSGIVAVRGRHEFRHVLRPAKRLQRTLGDLRDLKHFAVLGATSPPDEDGNRGKERPPGYRRRREKLLGAAIEAHRDLKRAGAC